MADGQARFLEAHKVVEQAEDLTRIVRPAWIVRPARGPSPARSAGALTRIGGHSRRNGGDREPRLTCPAGAALAGQRGREPIRLSAVGATDFDHDPGSPRE